MSNYKSVALIMARGIPGVGNTKNCIEMQKYCRTIGVNCDIFATNDKKWGRRNAQPIEIEEWGMKNKDECEALTARLNSDYDLVIHFSQPPKKTPDESVDNFMAMIDGLTTKQIMICVDHSVHSIVRNARMMEICSKMHTIFAHSTEGDLAKKMAREGVTTPMKVFPVGFNFDEHRANYWKPIEEQDDKTFKFIGRSAMWKGPEQVYDLHREHLKAQGFKTSLEGMELSIGGLRFFFNDGQRANGQRPDIKECLNYKKCGIGPDDMVVGENAYVFGDYKYVECMHRLSKTAFGCDFYNLKPQKYGKSFEYCHADVIASGTIPVFHKHFGQHTMHLTKDIPLIDCPNNGTIWVDENNLEETAQLMEKLANDPIARDKMREESFAFWKSHADAPLVYDIILKDLTI